MKTIADIRLFVSKIENINGKLLPQDLNFQNKKHQAVIHRIVMKLRERGFSLGDFDHLYVNFTTCFVENDMALSQRSIDPYHTWYRYYDVHVDKELFDQLHLESSFDVIIEKLKNLLTTFFSMETFDEECIEICFLEALTQGDKMLIKFKEKVTSKRKAIIYLRYLDNSRYQPLLRVTDIQNTLLLEADLPEMLDLNALGNIRVSLNSITIEPRKNAFSEGITPIKFNY